MFWKGVFINVYNFLWGCPEFNLPIDGQNNCGILPDCSGIECCLSTVFDLGSRNIYFKIRVKCGSNSVDFEIENEEYSKALSSLTDGKIQFNFLSF